MKTLHFTKMHGLGNDFMVVNALKQSIDYQQLPITTLANRRIGIGFDQLLIIEPTKTADFFCRIFNADGSEAEQCGNGLRCVARFVCEEGLIKNQHFQIETIAGKFSATVHQLDNISVTMGSPTVTHALTTLLLTDSPAVTATILSVGNPHTIVKIDDVQSTYPALLAPSIQEHAMFGQGTNVGFMQVINKHHIKLRTFERGAGETNACGSNACAAVVAGIENGWLESPVQVEYRYGSIHIEWQNESVPIVMTGPAMRVYSGMI